MHKAQCTWTMSSKICLFMWLGRVSDSKRKSFLRLMAFSTRILTLAMVCVSTVCWSVSCEVFVKKEGTVRNAFFLAWRSPAVKPWFARICCPGCNESRKELSCQISFTLAKETFSSNVSEAFSYLHNHFIKEGSWKLPKHLNWRFLWLVWRKFDMTDLPSHPGLYKNCFPQQTCHSSYQKSQVTIAYPL